MQDPQGCGDRLLGCQYDEPTGHVPPSPRRYVGIDLASQPRDTAACLIAWDGSELRVAEPPPRPLKDDDLLSLLGDPSVTKAAIDAPFGWPLAFIDALSTYRDEGEWLPLEHEELRFRATEFEVARQVGQPAMSVATSDLV